MKQRKLIKEELNEYKRERILTVAAELIAKHGYSKTNMDDIAAALGATKPFVYYYFGSKAELLDAICLRTISASNKVVNEIVALERSASWRLYHIISRIAELAIRDTSGTSVFFREERNLSPAALKTSVGLRKRVDSILTELVAEGVATGEFSTPNAKVAAFSVAGMVTWMFMWYRPTGPLGPQELCDTMARLSLQTVGVSPERANLILAGGAGPAQTTRPELAALKTSAARGRKLA